MIEKKWNECTIYHNHCYRHDNLLDAVGVGGGRGNFFA